MKIVLLLIHILVAVSAFGQADLDFAHRFIESEDRWVVFPKRNDSSYSYGFIYIDQQAGLTVDVAGSFKIGESGQYIPKKIENAGLKVRLEPSNIKVAFVPEPRFKELHIDSAIPAWLSSYKTDTSAIQSLFRMGFLYNHWNECAKALTYLERAKMININHQGLATELAFSYNCLKQYNKAIDVLKIALKENPADAYTNKELIYAQMKSGKLEDAAASCKRAIEICVVTKFHGENIYNLLYSFYEKKDSKNFYQWLEDGKKWNQGKEELLQNISYMENDMKNK